MSTNQDAWSVEKREGRVIQHPDGDTQSYATSAKIGLPAEAAILVAIDQTDSPEFKKQLMEMLLASHHQAIEISDKAAERSETRKDRQSEAYIERQARGQWMSFVIVLCALAVFLVMFWLGASAAQLWAIGVFLLGPAGVVAVNKFIKTESLNKD